jgi:hypothetical protein
MGFLGFFGLVLTLRIVRPRPWIFFLSGNTQLHAIYPQRKLQLSADTLERERDL